MIGDPVNFIPKRKILLLPTPRKKGGWSTANYSRLVLWNYIPYQNALQIEQQSCLCLATAKGTKIAIVERGGAQSAHGAAPSSACSALGNATRQNQPKGPEFGHACSPATLSTFSLQYHTSLFLPCFHFSYRAPVLLRKHLACSIVHI